MTVKEQITKWAKANYDKSYAAQCVMEGCYDDCDFAETIATLMFAGRCSNGVFLLVLQTVDNRYHPRSAPPPRRRARQA